MAQVKLTSALKRFFPSLTNRSIAADDVRELINHLEKDYPGISSYLVDDSDQLRKHVNIFVNGELINDRENLSDRVTDQDEVVIFQALSGG